jgi:two-component system sensor histidine kinase HydH
MRFDNREFTSWIVSGAVFAAAALFGVYELQGRLFTNELLARNEAERTLNLLLATVARTARNSNGGAPRAPMMPMMSMREGQLPAEEARDFVSAIETDQDLKDRILGVAAYGPNGVALFRYGSAPQILETPGRKARMDGSPPRFYRFDAVRRSLLIQHPYPVFKTRPDTPRGENRDRQAVREMMGGYLIHYELKEDQLFGRNAFAFALFALWLAGAAAAILIVRKTLRKNALYREELRNQKELVALGTAARTLAHEIKNPLSAIRLQTDLISRLAPGAADRELAVIAEETGRIRLLVDRIGDFLREPAGVPERLLLAEFAERTLERAGPGGKPVPVRTEADDAAVMADPHRLRSVLENLVRNAYDSGSAPEAVEARVREEGRQVVFEVLDRGVGLPKGSERGRVFDPFFTTKTSGFGLGLSLSRRFVEAAGGTLELVDREGGGAAARVSLPKAEQ